MSITDVMADQLRLPRGPLAPLVARTLNRRNLRLIEDAIRALDVRLGQRVLDLGFGGAVSLELLVPLTGDGHVAGVDPSPDLVALARRVLARHICNGRASVELGAADAIPYPDESFQRVLTSQTVYFWADLRAGLTEVSRVLRPGGRLAVAMMPRELQERHGFGRLGYVVLSHEDLMLHMEESGFTKVRRWSPPVPGPSWIVTAHRP